MKNWRKIRLKENAKRRRKYSEIYGLKRLLSVDMEYHSKFLLVIDCQIPSFCEDILAYFHFRLFSNMSFVFFMELHTT